MTSHGQEEKAAEWREEGDLNEPFFSVNMINTGLSLPSKFSLLQKLLIRQGQISALYVVRVCFL